MARDPNASNSAAPSPAGKAAGAQVEAEITEREALLARRLRELQHEVNARRRELSNPPPGALHLSRDWGANPPQTARDLRPDPLSRSAPITGPMSARGVFTRDAFGHLSWDDRDSRSGRELQMESPAATRQEETRGYRATDSDAGSCVRRPQRSLSTSSRLDQQLGHLDDATWGEQLPSQFGDRETLREGRHFAADSHARHEEAEVDDAQQPSMSRRRRTSESQPLVPDDESHPDSSRNDVGSGEAPRPMRRSMPATIREDNLGTQVFSSLEQDYAEEDATAQWMAGLRSSKKDDGGLSDPLVFGAGFKPPKRKAQPSQSESCGPWMASFQMGGKPLPSRRSVSDSKSSIKSDTKFEAKSESKPETRPEPKPEPKPQPRPDAKPGSNLGSQNRKPAAAQARPQATPQAAPQATTAQAAGASPPPMASQPGARARAESCPRGGAQSKSQARVQSPRGVPPSSNASPLGPRQSVGARPSRYEHVPRGSEGASGSGASQAGKAAGRAASPPPPTGPSPGRAPSPTPPGPSPTAHGAAPQGGATHRGTTGKARQGPRGKAEAGGSKAQSANESGKDGKRQSGPGSWLEALKAEMSRLRRVKSPDDRKKHFLKLCFQWHPDKNPSNVQLATKGFQMLQEQKARLLAA